MYKRLFHRPNCKNSQKRQFDKIRNRFKTNKQAILQKKIKHPMLNVDKLIDGVRQIVSERKEGTCYFTVLDLKYAYSQLKRAADTARQCNFNNAGETL